MSVNKPIRLSEHAKHQLEFRGATVEEIVKTIQESKWTPTKFNRFECKNEFLYNSVWNKKTYRKKQIRPIFVEEEREIVVITVYVYFVE